MTSTPMTDYKTKQLQKQANQTEDKDKVEDGVLADCENSSNKV